MATSKLNKEQYANIGSFAGIMLVYNSTNKDGELVQTAQHFFGADFEPADKSDNEIFRVIKNMVATMWHTIAEEKKLRADADGIRSKFRATTPAEIIICEKSGNRIKKYDLTDSVWARIGLVPTKVDLEKSNRDFQKTIHAAAKAIRNAMNFAPNLANGMLHFITHKFVRYLCQNCGYERTESLENFVCRRYSPQAWKFLKKLM